ncbi:MAG TPA: cytochrome b/b6 domain-containing protein, partial [Oscillatoriaceae cyanobacterium]
MSPEFPLWVRGTHFANLFFLSLLMRSGLEVLSAHPKLYWRDDATPGTEWAKLGGPDLPAGELWTSEDEAISLPSWLALPGRRNLGLGRHWHFWSVFGWCLTGAVYLLCLFGGDHWRRLIPTSWRIFPRAWQAFWIYAHLGLPPAGHPFNALQQLTYAAVIFVLAPLLIVTGLGMSAALEGRFPWINRWAGGHQGARSLHFLGLLAFFAFTIVHVAMVVAHGFADEMNKIVLGTPGAHQGEAVAVGAFGLLLVLAWHVAATIDTLDRPNRAQALLEIGIGPLRRRLFHFWISRQRFSQRSPVFRVNGRPPKDADWCRLAETGFADWRLEIGGLVAQPLSLSLAELRALPATTQTTRHVCIQGWTAFAEWRGVAVSELLARVRPT